MPILVLILMNQKDSLSVSERIVVLSLLELAFQKVGVKIKKESCKRIYKASNIRLGRSITASIKGPKGVRSMQIDRIEELGMHMNKWFIVYFLDPVANHRTKIQKIEQRGPREMDCT
jgi:hypothetical protein